MAKFQHAMFRRICVLGGILVIGAGGAWGFIQRGQSAGPRLRLPAYPLDLGEGKSGEILDGVFEIRNVGSSALSYRIEPSCGCSDLSPVAGTIPAGERQEVHIGVRLQGQGTEKNVRLTIRSDDAVRPVATYDVHVDCPAPFDVAPMVVDLGRVVRGDSRELPLTVRDDAETDGPTAAFSYESSADWCIVRPDAEGRRVRVILAEDAPVGFLSTEIVIKSADGRSMSVPVAAHVLDEIVVAPSVLFAGSRAASEGLTFLVWRPDDKPLGTVSETNAPPGVNVEELSRVADPRRRFRVHLSDGAAPEGARTIRLKFENLQSPVSVEVHPTVQ